MAFEGLLRAWSDERTLYRDAAFAIVDKPAGAACVASAERADGTPSSLPERLAAHGWTDVEVISGIPDRASGAVLVALGDQRASDRVPLELTGVAAVEDWRLSPSGVFGPERARIAYRVLRRRGARVLVELSGPVAAQRMLDVLRESGQPVVGDEAPAARATRLMLHVLRVRGSVAGEAPLPVEFDSWLAEQCELSPRHFARALARAGVERHGFGPTLGAFRLLGEEAGEIAGLSVERYGDHALLTVSSEEAARHEREMADCLMDHGAAGVYVKRRVRADLRDIDPASLAPERPLRGEPAPELLALPMRRFRCSVRLGDGLATGLFLDQRANWDRVFDWSPGLTFLNLFSYTGAFTLAAAAGGAASTTSVDLAGRALARLRENLELNAWSGSRHRLLKADVPAWLARAGRQQRRYDLIVLDPPSFGTRARGVLSTRRDNAPLLQAASRVLAPRGRLLCVSHHRKISGGELAQQLADTGAELGLEMSIVPLVGGWDCPSLPGVTRTKSVLAQLLP